MRLLPPLLATCVAVLSLLHGSARAQAADPTVAEDQAPANGTYDDATAETEGASRRINAPSHDAGFGFHTVRFRTEDGDVYSLHAPAITFDYWVGRRWGLMLHGAAYFPARAAQPGSVDDFRGSLRNEYDQRWGLDGSVMIGLHHELAEKLHLYTGIGVHLQVFRLNDAQFAPVEAVTFGVGAQARVRYDFHPHVHVGGSISAAIDPIDLIKHENRVVILFPVTFAVSLGTHF